MKLSASPHGRPMRGTVGGCRPRSSPARRPCCVRLRRDARARRDGLSPGERARMSGEVARNVLALPAVVDATTVMAFSSLGSEVDTASIIERLERDGRRVALPRVEGLNIVAVAYRRGDQVKPSSFGARS